MEHLLPPQDFKADDTKNHLSFREPYLDLDLTVKPQISFYTEEFSESCDNFLKGAKWYHFTSFA